MLRRARKLSRGDKDVAVVNSSLARPPVFPRGCPEPPRILLVGRSAEERVSCRALCRGMCGMVQVRLALLAHAHVYVAQLFNNLMISLGYPEYVTQGGDLGHMVRNPHTVFLFGPWY